MKQSPTHTQHLLKPPGRAGARPSQQSSSLETLSSPATPSSPGNAGFSGNVEHQLDEAKPNPHTAPAETPRTSRCSSLPAIEHQLDEANRPMKARPTSHIPLPDT